MGAEAKALSHESLGVEYALGDFVFDFGLRYERTLEKVPSVTASRLDSNFRHNWKWRLGLTQGRRLIHSKPRTLPART